MVDETDDRLTDCLSKAKGDWESQYHVDETLGRRWIAVEQDRQYAEDSQLRFAGDLESVCANGQNLLF